MGRATSQNLTQGNPLQGIVSFALPIMAGNLLQQLYNTADIAIVGRFEGDLALSAVGTCASLTMLFTALSIGLSIGAGVIVAQNFGANCRENVEKYGMYSLKISAFIGLVLSLLGSLLAGPLLGGFLQAPLAIRGNAILYFRIYALGLLFQFLYNALAAILRALGNSKVTFYVLLLSSLLNVALDLVFVGGLSLGVAGAAIATVLSQATSCIAAYWYVKRTNVQILRYPALPGAEVKETVVCILRAGIPMALQQVVCACGALFLQRLINTFPTHIVAAVVVVNRLENWMYIPIVGFQSAMATYTSQNVGAGHVERINAGIRQTLLLSVGITAGLATLVFCFGAPLVRLISNGDDVLAICLEYIQVLAPSVLIFAAYFPLNGALQGLGQGLRAAGYAMLALGLRIFFAYTMTGLLGVGYCAIWWSQTFAWGITLTAYFIYNWKDAGKHAVLVSSPSPHRPSGKA